jgi:hypothetical protein
MEATQKMVEDLTSAILGDDRSARKVYFIRESLQALVRLAKVEQSVAMKHSVELAIGMPLDAAGRRKSKLELRRLLETCQSRQAPLRF